MRYNATRKVSSMFRAAQDLQYFRTLTVRPVFELAITGTDVGRASIEVGSGAPLKGTGSTGPSQNLSTMKLQSRSCATTTKCACKTRGGGTIAFGPSGPQRRLSSPTLVLPIYF